MKKSRVGHHWAQLCKPKAEEKMNGCFTSYYHLRTNADKGNAEEETVIMKLDAETIYLGGCGSQPVGDVCWL